MNAIIYDIKRFAIHDGPGIRTTIFFKGCPLSCQWCHNPESRNPEIEKTIKTGKLDGNCYNIEVTTGEKTSIRELMREVMKEKVFMDESGGGVTFSGGEPLLQYEFVLEAIKSLKKEKIHCAIDTTGYTSDEIFERVAGAADLFLYDLKLMDDEKHLRYTGVSNRLILKNLLHLHLRRKNVIIRFPLIPGINDGENINQMKDFLLAHCPDYKEIHILPFHNIATHKYRQFGIENKMLNHPEPSPEEIGKVREFFEESGFIVNIGG